MVLRAFGARGSEGLLHDQTDPAGASATLHRLVGWGGPAKGRAETEHAWKVTADEVKARGYNLDIKNPHTADADHGDPVELLADLTAAEAETASLRNQLKAILAEALTR